MFPSFLLSCRDGGIEAEVTSGKFRLIINVSKCCRGLLAGVTHKRAKNLEEETMQCFLNRVQ